VTKKDRDRSGLYLFREIIGVIEASGAEGDDIINALVSALSRVIIHDAPDRQTAIEWHEMVGDILDVMVANCDADGTASWSKSRYH
jgi:hypothetical protein